MKTLIPENLTPEEIIEIKRQKLAAMTEEEQRERFLQACERADKRLHDEFVRQHMEHYKQTDHYKELVQRKQARQEKPAAGTQR